MGLQDLAILHKINTVAKLSMGHPYIGRIVLKSLQQLVILHRNNTVAKLSNGNPYIGNISLKFRIAFAQVWMFKIFY